MHTQFFTGTGDAGESRFGQKRVPKDDALFDALGALDAVNALTGWCVAEARRAKEVTPRIAEVFAYVRELQEMIFVAQAEVASVGLDMGNSQKITAEKIERLEVIITKADEEVHAITTFIVPGESELESRLDIARVRVRDAERALVRFSRVQPLPADLLRFINRLSSVYFALARFSNALIGAQEKHPTYQ